MNPKCCDQESIKNVANHKEFYYCRVCKNEVSFFKKTPNILGEPGELDNYPIMIGLSAWLPMICSLLTYFVKN